MKINSILFFFRKQQIIRLTIHVFDSMLPNYEAREIRLDASLVLVLQTAHKHIHSESLFYEFHWIIYLLFIFHYFFFFFLFFRFLNGFYMCSFLLSEYATDDANEKLKIKKKKKNIKSSLR